MRRLGLNDSQEASTQIEFDGFDSALIVDFDLSS
jgi:hypothetical protein